MIKKFNQTQFDNALAALGAPGVFFFNLRALLADAFQGFEASSRSVAMLCHSIKMAAALKIGSKLENAAKLTFEFSPQIEGFYFKVGHLPISFTDEDGRKCGVRHIPDALRFLPLPAAIPPSGFRTADYVRFAEIKSWDFLEKASRRGDRYSFDQEQKRFRCLSAEASAGELGFGYDMFTERDMDPVLVSNAEYLHPYFGAGVLPVPAAVAAKAQEVVAANQGIYCPALLASVDGLTIPRFCRLLAEQKLYVPLESVHLELPQTVQVFTDRLTSTALTSLVPAKKQSDHLIVRQRFPRFEPNEIITIRGKNLTVVISTAESVQFRTEKGDSTVVTRRELEELLKNKEISSLGVPKDSRDVAKKMLLTTPPARLRAALERAAVIKPVLDGVVRPRDARKRLPNFSAWLKRAKAAVREFGSPLIGMIDGKHRQGHHGSHLSREEDALISEVIESVYASERAPKVCSAYARYRTICKERGQRPVSEKTFRRRIRRYSVAWLESRRNGEMAGAAVAAPVETETPMEAGGRWFMHIGHMDELTFDLAAVFPELGIPLGTAWVGVMIDSYTRTVLAAVATFEAPGYVTTMALLRECVRRWNRLPEILFMDNGPGYKNDSLRLFAEYYSVQLCWRPPGRPRWGSEVERFIGDINQRVANELPGATKTLNRLRRISKSHHPDKLAVFGLGAISGIVYEWCYSVFDKLPHKGLHGKSPEDMRAISAAEHGDRPHLKISSDPLFAIISLPAPSGDGTAKVQAHDGVQVDNLYYWHNYFYDTEVVGTRVQVRYDPFDVTKVFAFVKDEWIQCDCVKLRPLRRLSAEDLCAASLEMRKGRSDYNKRRNEILERVESFLDGSAKKGEELAHLLRTKESSRQFLNRPSLRTNDDQDDEQTGVSGGCTKPKTPPDIAGFTKQVHA